MSALAPLLALIASTYPGAAGEVSQAPAVPVTAILVRHAETVASTETQCDPTLSEQGVERAEALAHLLGEAQVSHLYCSPFERTRGTLAPLAAALGLEVVEMDPRRNDAMVAALRGLPPGSVAVIAGHSNTVPGLVTALGGRIVGLQESPYGEILGMNAYDRLFVVTLPAGEGAATKTLELRYGE